MNASALFKKLKVVDEQDVLRMIERQLRQYDPALRAMARMKQDMDSTFMREDLTPEDKITLLKMNQDRFSQMKSSAGSTTTSMPAVRETTPQVLEPENIEGDDVENENEQEFHDSPSSPLHIAPSQSTSAAATSTSTTDNAGASVPGAYEKNLMNFEKILQSSQNFLKENKSNGELILEGESLPGSSFRALVQSLFSSDKSANLTGQTKFLAMLRKLSQSGTPGWPDLDHLCKLIPRTSIIKNLKAEPLSPASSANLVFTRAARAKIVGEKKGKGKDRLICKRKGIRSGPPGKRIKVMYLY